MSGRNAVTTTETTNSRAAGVYDIAVSLYGHRTAVPHRAATDTLMVYSTQGELAYPSGAGERSWVTRHPRLTGGGPSFVANWSGRLRGISPMARRPVVV